MKTKCPVCDSKKVIEYFCAPDYRYFLPRSTEYQYFRCLSCQSLFISNNVVNISYYKKAYGKKYYQKRRGIMSFLENIYSRIVNNQKANVLESLFKDSRWVSLLDIGAGDLKFLSSVGNKKFNKFAIDFYEDGKSSVGIEIIKGDFVKHEFDSLRFDVATAWHVIEHTPGPKDFLKKVHKILKPHGFLIISTPNLDGLGFKLARAKWYHLDTPRHLVLLNPKSFKELAESLGFRYLTEIYMPFEFPFDIYHSLSRIGKVLILPFYPVVKAFSCETITYVFQKI